MIFNIQAIRKMQPISTIVKPSSKRERTQESAMKQKDRTEPNRTRSEEAEKTTKNHFHTFTLHSFNPFSFLLAVIIVSHFMQSDK